MNSCGTLSPSSFRANTSLPSLFEDNAELDLFPQIVFNKKELEREDAGFVSLFSGINFALFSIVVRRIYRYRQRLQCDVKCGTPSVRPSVNTAFFAGIRATWSVCCNFDYEFTITWVDWGRGQGWMYFSKLARVFWRLWLLGLHFHLGRDAVAEARGSNSFFAASLSLSCINGKASESWAAG